MRSLIQLVLLLSVVIIVSLSRESFVRAEAFHKGNETEVFSEHGNETGHHTGVTLAGLNFEEVKTPLVISLVVIFAAVAKVAFHHAHWLSSKVPESCLLIVVGVILGAILHFSGAADHLPDFFEPHEFFLYLLPPIILEASYSLHDRAFYNNLGGILMFAVIGTVIACFTVGFTLYGLARGGALGHLDLELSATEVLIFAALIVAVDPVAVLAVFEEVGVNSVLYFMVFGESLLNDGVTVVIYKVMQELNDMETVEGVQIFLGFLAFFVVAFGGLLVGIIFGVLSALLTKYTNTVRVVEPIAVFGFAYLSYVTAELFEFSGIICMIGCGLVQMQYTFHNITDKSRTTIKYFTKVISTTSEIVIFLFLGLALVRPDHDFHVGFTLWTIFLTLVYRVIITFALSFVLNRFDRYRVQQLSFEEQFIISYGGLRGAVCFSLVAMLSIDSVPHKKMFVTTTLAVVIFTVFIQGISIKPLVKLLQIQLAPKDEPTLYNELNCQVTDHLMAGVEDIIGFKGKYYFKEVLEFYDDKYLKRVLQRNPSLADGDILRIYGKLALRDHVENLYACNAAKIPNTPAIASALSNSAELEVEFLKRLSGCSFDSSESQTLRESAIMMRHPMEESGQALLDTPQVDIKMNDPAIKRSKRGRKGVPDILTYKDLRKHLIKNPSRSYMHLKYDPYLSQEDKTDMLEHIRQKHLRNRRLQEYAVTRRPGLDRCMSWAGRYQPQESRDSTVADVRPNKAMSVDLSALNRRAGEASTNRLLGGGDVSRGNTMPDIPEQKESLKSDHEDEEEAEKRRKSSERKRSLFTRSDAMTEDSTSGEEIGMRNLQDKKV